MQKVAWLCCSMRGRQRQTRRERETDKERDRQGERQPGRGTEREVIAFCVLALFYICQSKIFSVILSPSPRRAAFCLLTFDNFWNHPRNVITKTAGQLAAWGSRFASGRRREGGEREREWHATRSSGEACQVNNLITAHKSVRAIDSCVMHIWSGIGLSLYNLYSLNYIYLHAIDRFERLVGLCFTQR